MADNIKQYYNEFLRRDPEPAGLQNYLNHLANGRSLDFIRDDISNSEEAWRIRIDDTYREILGRPAEEEGIRTYLPIMRRDRNIQWLRDEFLRSQEYKSAIVRKLYAKHFKTEELAGKKVNITEEEAVNRYTPLLRDGVLTEDNIERIFQIKKRISLQTQVIL